MTKKILTLDNIPVIKKNIGRIDTIEKLKASTIYSIGDVVEVLGFHAKGDGSHHKRIAKAEDDGSGEQGQNGIWWCILHNGEVKVLWFGAKGDGVADDTIAIQKALDFQNVSTLVFECQNYFSLKSYSSLDDGSNVCLQFKRNNINIVGVKGVIDSRLLVCETPENIEAVLYFEGRGVSFNKINIDANKKANICLTNMNDTETLSPYLKIDNCHFDEGLINCLKINSFMASFSNITVNGRKTTTGAGFVYKGLGPQPTTSTNFSSCYVQQCAIGFEISFLTYGTLNNLAVDHCDMAYKLSNMYGVVMNGCGCESSKKPITLSSFRGFSINSFYGLAVGNSDSSNPTQYLLELIGGNDCTISGFYINNTNQNVFYKYKAGLTSVSFGSEFINVLDGSITRDEFYFLKNSYLYSGKAVNFATDFETRNIDVTANNSSELNDILSRYSNKNILGRVNINLVNTTYNEEINITKIRGNLTIKGVSGTRIEKRITLNNSDVLLDGLQFFVFGGGYSISIQSSNSNITLKDCVIKNDGNAGSAIYSSNHSCITMINSYVNGAFGFGGIYNAYHDLDFTTTYNFKNISINNGDYLPIGNITYVANSEIYAVTCRKNSAYTSTSSNWEVINSKTSFSNLDTPYYTRKMEEEGIYEDYVTYRDELHEYENSQVGDDTMLLPVLQEPVIPESVKQFAEKYKLI